MSELKPCPFCGKEVYLERLGHSFQNPSMWPWSVMHKDSTHEATKCGMMCYVGLHQKENAIKAWNTRQWDVRKMAEMEDNCIVSVGGEIPPPPMDSQCCSSLRTRKPPSIETQSDKRIVSCSECGRVIQELRYG